MKIVGTNCKINMSKVRNQKLFKQIKKVMEEIHLLSSKMAQMF